MIAPLALAQRPTPVHPLPRLGAALGIDLWVKRDDLTGSGLGGNKVRKLEYLLADAAAAGADCVLTTGGIQSNHARATAVAARRLGLAPHLLLRGARSPGATGNLLLDDLLGADIRWCTPAEYADRDALLASWADALRAAGRRPYVIPEGGSNGLGALGYVAAAAELTAQDPHPFDGIVVAVGSGGTLAGLALGGLAGPVRGVAVCDDAPTFTARVRAIAADARPLGAPVLPEPGPDTWQVVDGWQGPGYAIATPEIRDTIRLVARTEGLLLDPVYTGKAMHALVSEARAGRWRGRWLFWHTGGVFGLFGRGAEFEADR